MVISENYTRIFHLNNNQNNTIDSRKVNIITEQELNPNSSNTCELCPDKDTRRCETCLKVKELFV